MRFFLSLLLITGLTTAILLQAKEVMGNGNKGIFSVPEREISKEDRTVRNNFGIGPSESGDKEALEAKLRIPVIPAKKERDGMAIGIGSGGSFGTGNPE